MDGARFDRAVSLLGRRASRRRGAAVLATFAAALVSRRTAAAEIDWGTYVDFTGQYCGGIVGVACPGGYTCVFDPTVCDPASGGADCSGTCQRRGAPGESPDNPCAAILCEAGTVCCPNCGGTCVPGDQQCGDHLCGDPCGPTRCAVGEVCCNDSCGICTPPDGFCTMQYCFNE